jgi:spermidine/putrescine transport system substrate-binding protein
MSDALQARQLTHGKIEYVVPEEGGTLWIDSFVIPQGAVHLSEAYALIDFFLDPSSGVITTTQLFLGPANKKTLLLLPKAFQENRMLLPPPSLLSRCEMIQDIGDMAALWDRIWTEIKAHP